MDFTQQRATSNEQAVCDLLNTFEGSDFKLHTNKRSCYDIGGFVDGYPTLVEVKERDKDYAFPLLNESKFDSIFAKAKKNYKGKCNIWLVISVKGKHKLYDMKDLWKWSRRDTQLMNDQTSVDLERHGNKINKKSLYFKKDWYMIDLNNRELGQRYERDPKKTNS